ncbi:Leucine rich repeat [Carpediemonas membranifera]|uniref:Leucine rich repeat n=1 Tax=Carpediemonas membranifera TaxID=201153 RepID=A0A8J6AVK7_9EUKA|nr:Leucine rich repeat [Carpediemonas membranifera]|eukprot:KAG9395293.1 Leucine rich repeat [Carpediemonas membranifera]
MKRPEVLLLVLISLLAAVMAAESCSSFSPRHCTSSRGCSWCASENLCYPMGADCPVLSECASCTLDGDYYCTTDTDAFCTSRIGCGALHADVKSCDLHANTATCTQCLDIPNAVWCPAPGSFCFSKLDKAAAQTCKQLTDSTIISDPPECARVATTCDTCLQEEGFWCEGPDACVPGSDADPCVSCEAMGGECHDDCPAEVNSMEVGINDEDLTDDDLRLREDDDDDDSQDDDDDDSQDDDDDDSQDDDDDDSQDDDDDDSQDDDDDDSQDDDDDDSQDDDDDDDDDCDDDDCPCDDDDCPCDDDDCPCDDDDCPCDDDDCPCDDDDCPCDDDDCPCDDDDCPCDDDDCPCDDDDCPCDDDDCPCDDDDCPCDDDDCPELTCSECIIEGDVFCIYDDGSTDCVPEGTCIGLAIDETLAASCDCIGCVINDGAFCDDSCEADANLCSVPEAAAIVVEQCIPTCDACLASGSTWCATNVAGLTGTCLPDSGLGELICTSVLSGVPTDSCIATCGECVFEEEVWCIGDTFEACLPDTEACEAAGGESLVTEEDCLLNAFICQQCVEAGLLWCPENEGNPCAEECDPGASYYAADLATCECLDCTDNGNPDPATFCADGNCVADPFICANPIAAPAVPQMCMPVCEPCLETGNRICVSETIDPYCVPPTPAGAVRCFSHGGILVNGCNFTCNDCIDAGRTWCYNANGPSFCSDADCSDLRDGVAIESNEECYLLQFDSCLGCTGKGGEWCEDPDFCGIDTCTEDPVLTPCGCFDECDEALVESGRCTWCVFPDSYVDPTHNHFTASPSDCIAEGGYVAESCGCGLECEAQGGICCVSCEGEDICVAPGDADRCISDGMIPIADPDLYSAIPCINCLCEPFGDDDDDIDDDEDDFTPDADDCPDDDDDLTHVYCPDELTCRPGDECPTETTVSTISQCFSCEECVILSETMPAAYCASTFEEAGCYTRQFPPDGPCNHVFCPDTCDTCVSEGHVWCLNPDSDEALCTTEEGCVILNGTSIDTEEDCHPPCCEQCAEGETCECECVPICPYDQCDECIADPLCSWCGAEVTGVPGVCIPDTLAETCNETLYTEICPATGVICDIQEDCPACTEGGCEWCVADCLCSEEGACSIPGTVVTDPAECDPEIDLDAVCGGLTELEMLRDVFYPSLNGDQWSDDSLWGVGGTPCAWHGVTCSGGHVIAIELSDNNLSGAIPPQIACLEYLKTLDLSHNSIGGIIPPEMSTMKHLKYLFLNDNQLRGPLPSFDLWTALQYAYFEENCLCGPIPDMGTMVALRESHFSSNRLSGPFPEDVLTLLPNNAGQNPLFEIRNACNYVTEPYAGFWDVLAAKLLELVLEEEDCTYCSVETR